jgi:hypothetical protein
LKNSVIETEKSDKIDEIFYICSVVRSMLIFFSSLDVMIRNILELQKNKKKTERKKKRIMLFSYIFDHAEIFYILSRTDIRR